MDIIAVLMVVRVLRHSPVIFQSGCIISLPLAAQIAFMIALKSSAIALVMHALQVVFHGFAALAPTTAAPSKRYGSFTERRLTYSPP